MPRGRLRAGRRASICYTCEAGKYGSAPGLVNGTGCLTCLAGDYCPEGLPIACPPNTNSSAGAATQADCFCLGGYGCSAHVNVSVEVAYSGNFSEIFELAEALTEALGGSGFQILFD